MRVSRHLPPVVQDRIDALESYGYKIRLHHDPHVEGVLPNGTQYRGLTSMVATNDSNNVHVAGSSYCGLNDNFDRSVGTHVAFKRMVHGLSGTIGRSLVKKMFE